MQGDCRDLVPEYLRFLYGLVDSRGPAAERLAGDAPGQHGHPPDPQRAGQGRARPPDEDGRGEAGRVSRPSTRPVRHVPEGRRGPRLRQPRAAGEAPPVRVDARPRGTRPSTSLDEYVGRMAPDQKHDLLPRRARTWRRSGRARTWRSSAGGGSRSSSSPSRSTSSSCRRWAAFGEQDAHLDRLGRPGPARARTRRPSRRRPSRSPGGFGRVLDLFREALGVAGQGGPRLEAAHRQPVLPGQRRRRHEHPDAPAPEDERQGRSRRRAASWRSTRIRPSSAAWRPSPPTPITTASSRSAPSSCGPAR